MMTEKLFSYGTLQKETVQLSTFGRKLEGVTDHLVGYKLSTVEIKDLTVIATSGLAIHPILLQTNQREDEVIGSVFDITAEELALADKYEVDDYKRIRVTLKSGNLAWTYVGTNESC